MVQFSRRRFMGMSIGCAAATMGALQFKSTHPKLQLTTRRSHALGTSIAITAAAPELAMAEEAIDAALSEIDAVESALSLYRPHSDLCRLNRDGFLGDPDPRLIEVLQYAVQMSEASGGAFDVTVQPLWEVYETARRIGRLPASAQIAAAKNRVDWRRIAIADGQIRLLDQTRITLNGIAQGYATDRAGTVLKKHGIEHALIDAGELAGLGRKANVPWRVGIQHPQQAEAYVALAELNDRALATSGDYATTFSADRRSHHLLDPATGCSPSQLASVSIAAPTAMEADALSTACFVLGVEEALALLRSRPACEGLFVTKDNRLIVTPGFSAVCEEVLDG